MKIPVFDLKRQFSRIDREILPEVRRVLSSGSYILGEEVASFEQEFARHCAARCALGVASGTDALKIALRACGIGPGDEVVTTPFTFAATAEAIAAVGAKIVFADINLDSYNIDAQEIESKITRKTRAILCVHLYGQPCDMRRIGAIARKHRLKLIEDCAQATSAEYQGKKVGTFGDAGCFSFYPTKNLGGAGDGGMIITNNAKLAEKIGMLRAHGSKNKFEHLMHGYNSRLDELQAAILRRKLKYLDRWNEARRKHSFYYNRRLSLLEKQGNVIIPKEQAGTRHVYHLYILRTGKRDALMKFLDSCAVGSSVHYPVPLHLQKIYRPPGARRGDFPRAETAAREILTLPLYPELKKKEIDYITGAICRFFEGVK